MMVLLMSRGLVRFPGVVLVTVGLTCLTLTILSFVVFGDFFDFSDPIKGFTTRRTEISNQHLAWENLQKKVKKSDEFYRFPSDISPKSEIEDYDYGIHDVSAPTDKHHIAKRVIEVENKTDNDEKSTATVFADGELTTKFPSSLKTPRTKEKNRKSKKKSSGESVAGVTLRTDWQNSMPIYCPTEPPDEEYVQIVMEVGEYESETTIKALCKAQQKLWQLHILSRTDECALADANLSRSKNSPRHCCAPWHLGSVLASHIGVSSCDKINSTAMEWSTDIWPLLLKCAQKKDALLQAWETGKLLMNLLPYEECKSQRIYTMLKYLLPKTFPNFDPRQKNYTMMILPLRKSHNLFDAGIITRQSTENIFWELRRIDGAWLAGMDVGFGTRNELFLVYLLSDSTYGILSVFLVLFCMWLYTGSFFFTLAAVIGIVMSAGFAVFVYRVVFQIEFFPFMNLLTFVLLIGVGADDTFIFRRAWLQAKSDKDCGTLVKIIHDTLSHACLSMLVTSLTTAAAFYSNLVSDIVVIKCFGVFAGTTILTNYLFVVTWLPAAVVLLEKYDSEFSCGSTEWIKRFTSGKLQHLLGFLLHPMYELYLFAAEKGRIWFEVVLPYLVIKLRLVWILFFGSLSVFFGVTVFHHPGLQLPAKDHFQFFKWSHPFEKYESELKEHFLFTSSRRQDPLIIRVLWGVQPVCDSGYLNPDDKGHLHRQEIDFTDNLSILWLRDFCTDLAKQNFTLYTDGSGPLLPFCFIVDFMNHMDTQACHDTIRNVSHEPCCKDNRFPYRPGTFKTCLNRIVEGFMTEILFNDILTSRFGPTGPIFVENENGEAELGAVVIAFPSTYNFSLAFGQMDEYYQTVDGWIKTRLASGPESVRGGFLASEQLQVYDLQKALLHGTKLSVGVAVAIAYLVLIATTLNVLISLLAITTISGVIFCTVSLLIFMDWELNVLESTIIILTIGLSFDFTLHYAVAYKQCKKGTREERVVYSLMRVSSPIFMSFITTMAAGSAMLFATTLAYFQIGLFMILQAVVSWLYSTFFFASLLRVFGPSNSCCQFSFDGILRSDESRKSSEFSVKTGRTPTIPKTSIILDTISDFAELEPMVQIAIKRGSGSSSNHRLSFKSKATNSVRRASIPVLRKASSHSAPKICATAPASARSGDIIRNQGSQNAKFINGNSEANLSAETSDLTSSTVLENRYLRPDSADPYSLRSRSAEDVWTGNSSPMTETGSTNLSAENKVYHVPNCYNLRGKDRLVDFIQPQLSTVQTSNV